MTLERYETQFIVCLSAAEMHSLKNALHLTLKGANKGPDSARMYALRSTIEALLDSAPTSARRLPDIPQPKEEGGQ